MWLATCQSGNVALKLINFTKLDMGERSEQMAEIDVMQSVHHPLILEYREFFFGKFDQLNSPRQQDYLIMVLEQCKGGLDNVKQNTEQ